MTENPRLLVLNDLKADEYVSPLITRANEHLKAIGYTEHGHRHAGLVSNISRNILRRLDCIRNDHY